jgi:hypothetical protein
MAEGETGSGQLQIARLEKGNKDRTAMHADVMNEIIDKLNALLAMQVQPAGKLIVSDANVVLDLTAGKTVDLHVCVEGVEKVATFYIQGDLRDP